MRAAADWIALALVMAWVGFAVAGPVGAGAIALAVLLLRGWVPVSTLMALLAPLGVMLPALALRQMAAGMGVAVIPFGSLELVVFLLAYLVFLASAMGVVPVGLYRFGYAPVPVAVMVLAACGYGALSGQVFLPIVAVMGQALWVMGWGSSNWFDHVLHAVLVPVTIVVLILRMV
ncbi:hypothetical protein SAMN05444414_11299 [Roseovarius marisflavi]|uniref:Uncharacterized protein n=1 Tax=Roseovarius marisflavi TaxID=1054996 RepID=A0A1M7A7Q9_9RHOB|nr:hypothetical protein [Roseovarius marisflavi]SHL38700.1 hypothetical protein SAMN05444414_11299 [Roseovarius marisflavi]